MYSSLLKFNIDKILINSYNYLIITIHYWLKKIEPKIIIHQSDKKVNIFNKIVENYPVINLPY